MPGFVTTQDGRCKIKGNNYIGEQCSNDDECEYPGSCKDGVCACLPPQRKLIEKEFWIDPTLAIQCRQEDYSICKYELLDLCLWSYLFSMLNSTEYEIFNISIILPINLSDIVFILIINVKKPTIVYEQNKILARLS